MRTVLTIVIGIHAVIHLFGFLKAFGISEFDAISEPISRPYGLLWLTAFLLCTASAISLARHDDYWWIIGLLAVVISQFLIIAYWSDAKFGTIINLLILAAALISYSSVSFTKMVTAESNQMLSNSELSQKVIVSEEMIAHLPPIVQKWLHNSGMVGREKIDRVYLEQSAQMLMKPEQTDWYDAMAKQYFTVDPPAFNWSVHMKMNPLMSVAGRDKFENGQGEMTIKLLSLIPVVNEKNNDKIHQATLQRYLAEIVWFPSAALSSYIRWEAVDDQSAKATMRYNETEGSGVFHFDENGSFRTFTAMRYADTGADAEPKLWTVTAIKNEVLNGITIPVELKAEWALDDGSWTWLKLNITNIEYGVQ